MYNEIGGVERVIQLLTSGGLGDAAMSFAKAEALGIERKNYTICHAQLREDNLDAAIVQFYRTQGIGCEFKRIPMPNFSTNLPKYLDDWLLENVKHYDHYLGTHWSVNNGSDMSSWEINPFPKVKYSKISDCRVLINPSSGGTQAANKSFIQHEIVDFIDKYPETVIIGKGKDKQYEGFSNSLYNKSDMRGLVDVIASSEVVISPEGFVAYFAAMCGKKVFCKNDNISAIQNRKHPSWDMTLINSIKDIKI